MSKLLPLEYCKLDRAARLLECEVEDIIHWNDIDAITLCLEHPGVGRIDGGGLLKLNVEQVNFITNIVHERNGISITKYSAIFPSNSNNVINDHAVFFFGLWSVLPLPKINNSILNTQQCLLLPYGDFLCDWSEPIFGYISLSDDDERLDKIENTQLFVPKPELEKLWKSINDGEPLDSLYSSKDLAAAVNAKDFVNKQHPRSRVSSQQTQMFRALISALIGKDETLLSQPYKLIDILQKELASKGIDCPIKTGDTLKKLLGNNLG